MDTCAKADFHAVLARAGPYQASSIHSRKRVISWGSRSHTERDLSSPVPSLPPPPPLPSLQNAPANGRSARERRLLSDLWLTSAATFRRLGKIEQARGAIQEAEVLDEENEAVWVQVQLNYTIDSRCPDLTNLSSSGCTFQHSETTRKQSSHSIRRSSYPQTTRLLSCTSVDYISLLTLHRTAPSISPQACWRI